MTDRRSLLGWALWSLALFPIGSQTASAASLSLVPTRLMLTAEQPIGAVSVRNDGSEAAVVQVSVAQWSQTNGADTYAATTDILATPPIFTVPPGETQLVRVGLRRTVDARSELSYRVFLQEVSPAPTSDFRGLHVALRFSVPVFVAPAKAGRASALTTSLQWHARVESPKGQLTVTARNEGAAHVQIRDFMLAPDGNPAASIRHSASKYLLPGQSGEWTVDLKPLPAAGTLLHVSGHSDAGPIETDVVVGAQ